MKVRNINNDLFFLSLDADVFLADAFPTLFKKPIGCPLPKGFRRVRVSDVVMFYPDDKSESCIYYEAEQKNYTPEQIKDRVYEHCAKGGEVGYYIKKVNFPSWEDYPVCANA